MLQVVPDHLEQVAISIETLLDVNDLTVEEVIGRLRNIEQRKKNIVSAVDQEGRLLLTEEEWLACLKLCDDTGESNGPSSRKGGKKPWKSRRHMRGKEEDQKKEEPTDDEPIQCSYCGKRDHLSKNCWSKLRNKETLEKAHVAQSEEDEPTLFMVTASVLPDVKPEEELPKSTEVIDDGITTPVSVEPEEELQLCITKAPAGEPIQLKEERVFAQIGERGEQQEHRRWVLDTGATNHMTRAKFEFSELDSGIRGTVKFGDGSVVEIEGHDTILFVGKGGKHHKLTDVYFISRLKANIVSLGQLNKAGCHISIKRGLLRIRDDRRRLLTQVRCTANCLYILELEIEQPVNLSARYRRMEDLLGRGEPPGLAARQLEEEVAEHDGLEDMPPGTPSHRAQIGVQTK
ncbi:uncharacterized protein LOC111467102 [Cucurbita maxima]|uniref:Uncharacterized protein LOC111467102 n=1 Tax=Cucurbita maxima TaxID=3661 RepID=A0A6J1HVQ4_CUCMA|nr:uncharacterized protein LOC111467102 [Cucurbita maxima]